MEGFDLVFDSVVWLVPQLREHKLSWARALSIVGSATFAGAVTGWILFRGMLAVGILACLSFMLSVGTMAVIARKRELEREWEWMKTVEPSEDSDPFAGWRRHE